VALHDVGRAGKVRYLARRRGTLELAKVQQAADLHGCTRFVVMQDL
jgi:hypothetical protein